MPGADDALNSAGIMIRAEAFAIHQTRLRDRPEGFGDDVRRRLRQWQDDHRHRLRRTSPTNPQWRRTLENHLQQLRSHPHTLDGHHSSASRRKMIDMLRLAKLTYGWSAGGLPALSLPCGFSDAGLPIGLQLAASWFSERSLIRAGTAYQTITHWHEREPALPQSEARHKVC